MMVKLVKQVKHALQVKKKELTFNPQLELIDLLIIIKDSYSFFCYVCLKHNCEESD